MKRWLPLLVLPLCGLLPIHGATVQEVYEQAVRASLSGDTARARELFLEVLAADPQNKPAAAYLRRIEMATAKQGNLKSRAEAMNIPEVDFKDASLTSVIDFLPKLAAEQGVTMNVVRLFPPDYGDQKKITLQLSGVPMASVIEYVSQLGGVTASYEKSAVVFRMPESAAQ